MGQEPTPAAATAAAPAAPAASPEPAAATPQPTATPPAATEEPKTFSEEYVKQLRDENAKHRIKNSELEAELGEFRDRDKTTEEKLTGQVGTLTAANQELEIKNLRLQVAIEKKLPAELIDRLQGKTKEELAADADKLVALVKTEGVEPPPDFNGGPRTPPPEAKTPEQAHNSAVLEALGIAAPSTT